MKAGEIIPTQLDEQTALNLMVNDPLLIRRPLMEIDGIRREIGFDQDKLANWIGLEAIETSGQRVIVQLIQQDLETCPNSHQSNSVYCSDR
ncbi:MAG: ArsC/Spx/MgsR family protein [Snowella sp.]|nr:ArsC/Spx/MgsR family protein [Snowella sp.]